MSNPLMCNGLAKADKSLKAEINELKQEHVPLNILNRGAGANPEKGRI